MKYVNTQFRTEEKEYFETYFTPVKDTKVTNILLRGVS